MNISRAFVEYMESLSLGNFGEDIFIGAAPLNAPDPCWWIVAAGGASSPANQTGERLKEYTLTIFYRNTSAEDVYDQMEFLEEEINSKHCTQLTDHDTVDMTAVSFPADQDIDDVERTISLLTVNIRVYQS